MAVVIDRFYGTGRRKTSVARVWVRPGPGRIMVNRRSFEDYFPRETLRMIIAQPLQITNTHGQFDVIATVEGGGPSGQAGAVRHGIARALVRFDDKLRPHVSTGTGNGDADHAVIASNTGTSGARRAARTSYAPASADRASTTPLS